MVTLQPGGSRIRKNSELPRLQSIRLNFCKFRYKTGTLPFVGYCLFLLLLAGCSKSSTVEEISADGKTLVPVDLPVFSENDWPWWRGPDFNGIAKGDKFPVRFDENTNVKWSVEIPGEGSSSPIVFDDLVVLTSVDLDSKQQFVFCYSREDGTPLWKTEINQGGLPKHHHAHSSHAATTPATDGERIFVTSHHHGSIWVDALDRDGNKLWKREVGGFDAGFGFSVSPLVYRSFVIVCGDSKSQGGFIAALHRATGEIWWRKTRKSVDSHSSPIIVTVGGTDQVLLEGGNQVVSYDPMTGDVLWSTQGSADLTCGTVAFNDRYAIASGGYPQQETVCLDLEAGGEIVWRKSANGYVPSLLALEDRVILVTNDGRIFCWNLETGQQIWRKRLPGGFYASPILAGKNIYLPSRNGTVHVFRGDENAYREIAANRFDGIIDATPVACGGQLFLRITSSSLKTSRLICITDVSGDDNT